jgi:hypothetical protein
MSGSKGKIVLDKDLTKDKGCKKWKDRGTFAVFDKI